MLVPMYVHFAGGSPQRWLTRRLRRGWWGCRPRGEKSFLSKRKKVPKKARGTATPEAAHVAMHCGQALRCAWAWLRASWLSAISGASRPSASLGRRLRACGTSARCPQPSVLRTLDAACPAARRRLRTALPLRGVLALGASHPCYGPCHRYFKPFCFSSLRGAEPSRHSANLQG